MAYFQNLFSFSTDKGVTIPDTLAIKAEWERVFVEIFGADVDLNPSTHIGRIIEALTFFCVDVLGVNAQNANSISPSNASGNWLDMIGAIFGVIRLEGESDTKYRERLRNSQSRGMGYVQSIWNAVGAVDGVTSVCVLENGYADPMVVPNIDNGIALDPHSIFVCVSGGDDEKIARAIYSTKSAGCAYHISNIGTSVDVTIEDAATNSSTPVRFYRPVRRYVKVNANIRGDVYTGSDIVGDTKNAIIAYINAHDSNASITPGDLITAIGAYGAGIICTSLTIDTSDDNETWAFNVPLLVIRPYQYISVESEDISVGVL